MSGALNHSPGQILQQLLIDQLLGTAPSAAGSFPVYYSVEVNSPDDLLTTFDSESSKSGKLFDGTVQEKYGTQVRCRTGSGAGAYKTNFRKCNAIVIALDPLARVSVTIDSNTYLIDELNRVSGPLSIGQDEQKRRLFTINYLIGITQTV